jgi:hypothetical protein
MPGIVDEDAEEPVLLRGTVDEVEACGLGTNVSLRGDLGAGGLLCSLDGGLWDPDRQSRIAAV